jgi:enterochelin esterase-like enzyme
MSPILRLPALLLVTCLLVILSSCSPGGGLPAPTGEPARADDPATTTPAAATPTLAPTPSPARATPTTPETSITDTPTPTPLACLQEEGRMVLDSLRSDKLKLPMEYRVWLPPCYDEKLERRYPVLYMIHGQNYNEDQWDRLGIDETAGALISSGELAPFLIVMPRDRNWSQPAEDPFGEVLVEALVPFIDASYRTIPAREARAVGGLSRGAGWAVHLGFSRWDLFGAIGAHSLPVFWTDTPKLHRWMDEMPPDQRPRIYLDIGDRDRPQILESARWFEELLTRRGFAHVWHLFPGYHEEKYWESHVEKYLRWYAEAWAEP